jgi:hypothetical protein
VLCWYLLGLRLLERPENTISNAHGVARLFSRERSVRIHRARNSYGLAGGQDEIIINDVDCNDRTSWR